MNRKHIEIINKRQEEIERRLDRSWRPKSGGRVLRGGNIVYDVSSRMGGVSSGGLGLIVQLVKRLRVAERIDERVRVLKRHLPYRESDHVLNLIYNVMSGGVCLQDVKSRREDVSYLESVGARRSRHRVRKGTFSGVSSKRMYWPFKKPSTKAVCRCGKAKQRRWASEPRSTWTARRPRPRGVARKGWISTTKDNGGMDPWW